MQFNVAQLLKEPIGAVRRHEINEEPAELTRDLFLVEPLHGNVQFLRVPDGVLVTGKLLSRVKTECVRCLRSIEEPFDLEIEEEYKATIDIATGKTLPVTPDDDRALLIDSKHVLDLSEVVRQDALLAQDLTPLCQPDCKGLCPTCGKNLNDGECDCKSSIEDSRWTALAKLLNADDETLVN